MWLENFAILSLLLLEDKGRYVDYLVKIQSAQSYPDGQLLLGANTVGK